MVLAQFVWIMPREGFVGGAVPGGTIKLGPSVDVVQSAGYQAGMTMRGSASDAGDRFSAEIIGCAVRLLYIRLPLGLRVVEEMAAASSSVKGVKQCQI